MKCQAWFSWKNNEKIFQNVICSKDLKKVFICTFGFANVRLKFAVSYSCNAFIIYELYQQKEIVPEKMIIENIVYVLNPGPADTLQLQTV